MKFPIGLGLAGLIPFWSLAVAYLTGAPFGFARPDISFALAVYAATIASFLGGIRWGFAVREANQTRANADYVMSVLPQLISWGAMLLESRVRLMVLAAVLLITGPLDYALIRRSSDPHWFGRLRIILSLLGGASLLVVVLA